MSNKIKISLERHDEGPKAMLRAKPKGTVATLCIVCTVLMSIYQQSKTSTNGK